MFQANSVKEEVEEEVDAVEVEGEASSQVDKRVYSDILCIV